MLGDEIEKARKRVERFFGERRINRRQFAARAVLHRNTLYGASDKWTAETLVKCIKVIEQIEAEEAKAQRKPRPSLRGVRAAA